MKKEPPFETPELIIIVTDNKNDAHFEKILQKGLDQIERPHTALSLFIEPRHLKNMLTAIKLMDVKGVLISGGHQKHGHMFADTPRAKTPTNVVALEKNRYYGYNILSTAYRSYIGKIAAKLRKSTVSVFGCDYYLDSLIKEISKKKTKKLFIFKSGRKAPDRTSQKKNIRESDIHIICGPTTFKIPPLLFSNMNKKSTLIDMRDGVVTYPPWLSSMKKRLPKNDPFLAHLAAAAIRLWTGKTIDINKI